MLLYNMFIDGSWLNVTNWAFHHIPSSRIQPGDTDWQQRDDQRDQREIHMEVAHLRAKKQAAVFQLAALQRDHELSWISGSETNMYIK